MVSELSIVSEPVTFFDVLAQGRIYRADERRLIEQHISAARQHIELACNRNDFHRAIYSAPEAHDLSCYHAVETVTLAAGIRTFRAGRISLDTLPLARLLILQVAIDSYDARAAASDRPYSVSPTFRSAINALRMPASRPL